MKAAAYLRVSTADQTVENQRLAIERYALAQGWTVVEWYADEGISGTKDDRPALNKLKKDAVDGKFAVAICWKFDRMARSTVHLLEILSLLKKYGCGFVSVSEAIDTTTAAGRMVLTFLSAVGEFEVATMKERINLGIARAKAEGIHCGRPRKSFDVAEAIRLKKEEGLGVRRIAKRLGVSYGTIHRALQGVTKGSEV